MADHEVTDTEKITVCTICAGEVEIEIQNGEKVWVHL